MSSAMRAGGLALIMGLTMSTPAWGDSPIFVLRDPTPNGAFTGQYRTYCSENRQGQTQTGSSSEHQTYCTRTQEGYLAVYSDGVEACNGNPSYAPYDQNGDGKPDALQGYIWVGPNHRATGDILELPVTHTQAETPGGYAGIGSNHGKPPKPPTGKPPCPQENPQGTLPLQSYGPPPGGN